MVRERSGMLQPLRAFPGDGPAYGRMGQRDPRYGTVLTPHHPTPLARAVAEPFAA